MVHEKSGQSQNIGIVRSGSNYNWVFRFPSLGNKNRKYEKTIENSSFQKSAKSLKK